MEVKVKEIINALNRTHKWLEVNIPPFASAFQPKLSFEEIQNVSSKIGFEFPEEIYDLYQWRNGVDRNISIDAMVFPSGEFLPLNIALNEYQNLIDSFDEDQQILFEGQPLFPFYEMNGHCYAVLLSSEKRESSPVVKISDINEHSISYQSLTAMFLMVAECYETGAYYIESEGDYQGVINLNSREVSKILIKYNPKILERVLSNLGSLVRGEKDYLDSYNYLEYTYSVLGQLRRFREIKAVEMLLDYLNQLNSIPRGKDNESAIAETVYTLGYMADSRVIPYISSLLNDQSEFIRYRANEALLEQGNY